MCAVPPRYAYWTILIDNGPTAFRAAKREDLLPTFAQLQRTNPNIVMKWFARGRLWNSPEEARAEAQRPRVAEKRGRDWRPGGQHTDPRARFDKRKKNHRPRRDNDVARGFQPGGTKPPAASGGFRPSSSSNLSGGYRKPFGKPRGFGPSHEKPSGADRLFRPQHPRPPRPEDRRGHPPHAKPARPGDPHGRQPGPSRDRRRK